MPLPYRPLSCSVEGRSLKVKPWKLGTVPLFSHDHKWTYRWLSWHVHYSSSSSLGLRSIMDIDACTDRSSFEGLFAAKEAQVQRHNGGSTTITINLSSQSSASSPSSLTAFLASWFSKACPLIIVDRMQRLVTLLQAFRILEQLLQE